MSKLCPKCGAKTRTKDTRRGDERYQSGDKHDILRVKVCTECPHSFETIEKINYGVYRHKQTGMCLSDEDKPKTNSTSKRKHQSTDDFLKDLASIAQELED